MSNTNTANCVALRYDCMHCGVSLSGASILQQLVPGRQSMAECRPCSCMDARQLAGQRRKSKKWEITS